MKFSIVTPSYNQSQFISQTIDSVINQKGDYQIEYFVYDGGSTDDTVDILKIYEKQLKNSHQIKFYWQSKKDKGQSDAINQALSQATGDIFAYINSDDTYTPNIFQKVTQEFTKHPNKNWLTGFSKIINENNSQIQKPITWYKNFWLNMFNYNSLLVLNYISQPSSFFKRELFAKFGPFDENLHLTMDYDFWLKIAKENNPIILNSYISNFRIHRNSKGKSQYTKQFTEDFDTVQKYTKNNIILFLHRIHNLIINFVYLLVK